MPNIKPVSDLRNYGEVLRDVTVGIPLFLTKNGRGRYVIMDIEDYKEHEMLNAWKLLKAELDKGRQSGDTKGWVPSAEVRKRFEEEYSG